MKYYEEAPRASEHLQEAPGLTITDQSANHNNLSIMTDPERSLPDSGFIGRMAGMPN